MPSTERDAWDARVSELGGDIVVKRQKSNGIGGGRMWQRVQALTFYVVRERREDAA